MDKFLVGKITNWNGMVMHIEAEFDNTYVWDKFDPKECEIRLIDSRSISKIQRRKAYKLLKDISLHTGHQPEELKEHFKYDLILRTDYPYFSLSNCEMSVAYEYITLLIEFCLEWDVPTRDALLEYAPDIGKFLYMCLYHKKCCICQKEGETHHVDRVGIGRNRNEICHIGMLAQCLCRKHHDECHNDGQISFNEKYHVFGIKLDKLLVKRLKLGKWRDEELVCHAED